MKFIKQKCSLKLPKLNFEQSKHIPRHGTLLPDSIRCIVCGPSNCGKTNLMIGLLIHENGLRFQNVYVYSKTLYQPKYTFLERVLSLVPSVTFSKYSANHAIISSEEAQPNSIMIFDDVASEKQNPISEYFSMGRHKNIDSFYLNQTYSKVPKQLIRDNANLIVLFKQDDINLKHVYDEHVNVDMTWVKFRDMCSKIWNVPYGYLVINKDCEKNKGCYRSTFDTFIMID